MIKTKMTFMTMTEKMTMRKIVIGIKVEVSLRLFDIFERNMIFIFLWRCYIIKFMISSKFQLNAPCFKVPCN